MPGLLAMLKELDDVVKAQHAPGPPGGVERRRRRRVDLAVGEDAS
jgi:hypothetical protein